MKVHGIEIAWEVVGATLASMSDGEQAAFFKGFIKELVFACQTRRAAEMQLSFVNDKLTTDEKDLLSMLGYQE